ncbi:MAG: MFS transporter [Proteobacteria bacterium]|nr:MFS transporter [Pseudomonadota bacterium]
MKNKNFILGVINGILFFFSATFISSSTVLPVFISNFTSSSFILGLVAAIEATGWQLPQAFVARYLEDKKYKKFMYVIPSYIRSGVIFLIAILTYRARNISHYLVIFLLLYSVYLLGGGVAGISFMDIVSKVIPPRRRGSFWGLRMGIGGILALIGGYAAKVILGKVAFPKNYAILFLIASIGVFVAVSCFSAVNEPPETNVRESRGYKSFFKNGIEIFVKDKKFKTLFVIRALFALFFMSVPFYIIYIKRSFNLPDSYVGYFIIAQMTGYVLSNLVWSRLSNRNLNAVVIRLSSISLFLTAILTIVGVKFGINYLFLLIPFVFLGAGITGMNTGYLNSLLAIAPGENRQLYLGFFNTMLVPFLISPPLAGYIIRYISYAGLFTLASVIAFAITVFSYVIE